MADIDGKSFVIVKHTYFESPGTPEAELVRYLRGQAQAIFYIRNPFPDATAIPPNTTIVQYGPGGSITREITAPSAGRQPLLSYFKDVLFSVWYTLRSGGRYDLYVGADNLNTLAGLVLRMLGRVRKVAYYVIDFTPRRFPGRLMNAVYQAINRYCCYHADYIWNVSVRMIEGREAIGIRREKSALQLTVPLGCRFDDIPRLEYTDIAPHDIVYFGMLRAEHGPGLIIEALPQILERFPDARAVFAGDGELRSALETRAAELGVAKRVVFHGFVASDDEVYRILSRCGLALATYPPGDTYKAWSDPGKVKIYLACGLPVLITDVPPVAREIHEREAGTVVPHDAVALVDTVAGVFGDPARHERMRQAAIGLAREYDWNAIWERTFAAMDF